MVGRASQGGVLSKRTRELHQCIGSQSGACAPDQHGYPRASEAD